MPQIAGKHIVMRMLQAEGVKYIFGNPGTTETPFLDAVQDYPDIQYMLATQEAPAIGMADAYARATGRPSFANLHVAGGLANGISMLYDAYRGGTPLVLTAGQSDTRMLLQEPTLSGDLVEMTRQYTKWSFEVHHAKDIPEAMRRAFKIAKTPPTGPVFLALPWNVLDEEADVDFVPSSDGYFRIRPDAQALEKASEILANTQNPLMVVGDRIAQSMAVEEAVRVAELLGTPVRSTAFSEVNFPTSHPLYLGALNLASSAGRKQFEQHDAILAVGTNVFSQFFYTDPILPPGVKLVHLDSTPYEIERSFPVAAGLWADPKAGLTELAGSLEDRMSGSQREAAVSRAAEIGDQKQKSLDARNQRGKDKWDNDLMPPERMMKELADALPSNATVVDESITSGGALRGAIDFDEPGSFFSIRGGALGWAMGGALGVHLAQPDRKVVAVVGDGAAMYTIQSLWTAARYNMPVTYVICNNQSYRILKNAMVNYLSGSGRDSEFVGMNFHENPMDYSRIAEGFGLFGQRVSDSKELRAALEKAFAHDGPSLVDVVIDGALDNV